MDKPDGKIVLSPLSGCKPTWESFPGFTAAWKWYVDVFFQCLFVLGFFWGGGVVCFERGWSNLSILYFSFEERLLDQPDSLCVREYVCVCVCVCICECVCM